MFRLYAPNRLSSCAGRLTLDWLACLAGSEVGERFVMSVEHRPPLGTRRLLSCGRGAALLRATGEIDWWCPDRFDAAPVLWRLLDPDGATGRWCDVELATWDGVPAGPVAHSTVRTAQGLIDLWDGLLALDAGTVLVRLARPRAVDVVLVHELRCARFGGGGEGWSVDGDIATTEGMRLNGRHRLSDDAATLWTDVALSVDRWNGVAISSAGLLRIIAVEEAERMMGVAEREELRFVAHVQLPHDHPSRATDALRVLRGLTDAGSGAPVAAPTTSLPEAVGGSRQFDYRYTWLRDSAYACATAALLGRTRASAEYLGFVGRLLDEHDGDLPPLLSSRGDDIPAERVVDGVGGWAGSQPVRTGNSANAQQQLDSIGTVVEAVSVHVQCGGKLTPPIWGVLDRMATVLAETPVRRSNGIWEFRDNKLLVSEELARWVGLDKAIRLRQLLRPWRRRPQWKRARAAARARLQGAWDESTGMLPQTFDGPFVADAATLLAAIHGFLPRDSAVSRRFVSATIDALGEGSFLRRYRAFDDGFKGVEGAFLPASWWAVSALVAAGDIDTARLRADTMCAQLPPLLPEQWSVEDGIGLGNTPLLWSHTEMARALYNLHVARIRHRYGRVGAALWRCGRYARLRFIGGRV